MNRLIIAAPFLLAACNSQPTVTAQNASVAEVAAKTKDVIKLQAGQWSSVVEVLELDMPGMKDPRLAGMIGDAMKKSQAKPFTYCVTPEQAEKPSSEMFAGKNNGECRYDNFSMAGGRIEAAMTCSRKDDPGKMVMNSSGTYSPTAYDMTASMKMTNAQMPGGAMTMKVRTKASRTGECKAEKGKTI